MPKVIRSDKPVGNLHPETARYLSCTAGDALFMAERSTWWEEQAITYVRLKFQRGYRMTTRY